ncbi:hypothetical protein U1Q18_002378, partial [Sarracenia purpurea var. burkii]
MRKGVLVEEDQLLKQTHSIAKASSFDNRRGNRFELGWGVFPQRREEVTMVEVDNHSHVIGRYNRSKEELNSTKKLPRYGKMVKTTVSTMSEHHRGDHSSQKKADSRRANQWPPPARDREGKLNSILGTNSSCVVGIVKDYVDLDSIQETMVVNGVHGIRIKPLGENKTLIMLADPEEKKAYLSSGREWLSFWLE